MSFQLRWRSRCAICRYCFLFCDRFGGILRLGYRRIQRDKTRKDQMFKVIILHLAPAALESQFMHRVLQRRRIVRRRELAQHHLGGKGHMMHLAGTAQRPDECIGADWQQYFLACNDAVQCVDHFIAS